MGESQLNMAHRGWICFSTFWVLLGIQEILCSEIQRMCISCGFPKVSPDNDVYGSYGLSPGLKRYNHSCDEYDSLNSPADDPFVRICPLGVKSCFYITGQYGDQSLIFRGCAEAMYEHEYGCDSDLQAVDVIDQRGMTKQVDVDVNICFCSSQNCNEIISSSDHTSLGLATVIFFVIVNISNVN